MVRREPDPLPRHIPQPVAAPVSTYWDPRTPLPKKNKDAEELLKFSDALFKWGLMKRQDEKEEIKAQVAIDVDAAFSVEDLQKLADAGLTPDLTNAPEAATTSTAAITEEDQARQAEFNAAHQELRQRWLDFRAKGLAKNADPFYRKWVGRVMGEKLANAYRGEVGLRLRETYELSADTGQPKLDYSDLSKEIHGKYAPLLAELGIFGEEAYAVTKGKADLALGETARLALNEREQATAVKEWSVNGVTTMVNGFLDGTFDAGEFAGLQAHYRDARFEVDDVRQHFVSNMTAAAKRFLQMERDGVLEVGKGKELALNLLNALVPDGDDEDGVVLGTTKIKNDVALRGQISDLKDTIEADIEKDAGEADRRLRREVRTELYDVARVASEQPNATKDTVYAALEVIAQRDGLDPVEVDVMNSLVAAFKYKWDKAEADGEWDAAEQASNRAEYYALESAQEKQDWLVDNNALVGDLQWATGQFEANRGLLSQRIQEDPQIAGGMGDAKQAIYAGGGPEYLEAQNALVTKLTQDVNATTNEADAMQLIETATETLSANAKTERERIDTTLMDIRDHLLKFRRSDAQNLLNESKDTIPDTVWRKQQEAIDRAPGEQDYLNAITESVKNVVEAEMAANAIYADWESGSPMEKGLQDMSEAVGESATIKSALSREADALWKKGIEDGVAPRVLQDSINKQIRKSAAEAFKDWLPAITVASTTGGMAVVETEVVRRNTTRAVIESQKSSVPSQVQPLAQAAITAYAASGSSHPASNPDRNIYPPGKSGQHTATRLQTIPQRLAEQALFLNAPSNVQLFDGANLTVAGKQYFKQSRQASLVEQRASDEYALQYFLKHTSPPAAQDGVCEQCLTGTHGISPVILPGDQYVDRGYTSGPGASRMMALTPETDTRNIRFKGLKQQSGSYKHDPQNSASLNPDQLDATAITVGRTFLIGAQDLVSGTWTVPAGEKVPDFSKWDDLNPFFTRADVMWGKPANYYHVVGKKTTTSHKGALGVKQKTTTKMSFGEMRRFGMQADYVVDISPTRMQSLGLPAFNPDKNLILRTQADFDLLAALSINPDGEEADGISTHVEVGGSEVPYAAAQRRVLASFGITESTVADPASLADDRLHLWVKDLLGRQMILSQRLDSLTKEE